MSKAQAKPIEGEIEPPKGKVVAKQEAPVVSTLAVMLSKILQDPTLPIDRFNQALDFYERVNKADAKRAYTEAKSAFKANAPVIIKDLTNSQFKNAKYNSIGNTVNVVNEALSQHGFDASWEFDQTESTIKVTCILTHAQGHSERVSLAGPPDVSGAKNPLQQIKSTTTYLKLATFEAVTGIASRDGNLDDDGNAAGRALVSAEPVKTITNKQVEALAALIKKTKAPAAMLQIVRDHFQITDLADLTEAQHDEVTAKLKTMPGVK